MENPLEGFFNRERTVLVFRQRSLEVTAAMGSLIVGSLMFLWGMWGRLGGGGLFTMWLTVFGLAFAVAGGWAYLLFRYIRFDLRKRTYLERYGSGFWIKWHTGSIDEINCLGLEAYQALIPEMQFVSGGWTVGGSHGLMRPGSYSGKVFVVRLWWRDRSRYPPVVQHLYSKRVSAYSPDGGAGTFHALAQAYANALGVPLYGNLT